MQNTSYKENPRPYSALEMNCGWSVQGAFDCDTDKAATCDIEKFVGASSISSSSRPPLPQEAQTPYLYHDPFFSEPAWIQSDETIAARCRAADSKRQPRP